MVTTTNMMLQISKAAKILLIFFFITGILNSARVKANVLKASTAKINIIGNSGKDIVIHDSLYARALVFHNGSEGVVILSLDTRAIGKKEVSGMIFKLIYETEFITNWE